MTNNRSGFIAVHVGAGQHSESLHKKYQKLCKEACKVGIDQLKSGSSSLEAVVSATVILENSDLTNAGFGSNLTLTGEVECDASVMDGSKLFFGAVGAVSGIKNPINLAKRLCEFQANKISYGRIPPSILVGSGAQVWAQEMGIETLAPENQISMKAKKIYNHYKRKLEGADGQNNVKIPKNRLDTVGAVCVDAEGNIAAACSSGGIILKYPGRVGQAGVWGCGVWASNGPCSVGVTTSGCGEHLIRTTLARTIADAIKTCDNSNYVTELHQVMKKEFIDSEFLKDLDQRLGGAIVLRYSTEEAIGDLLWTHSTNSMIIGYMNSNDSGPKTCVSLLEQDDVGKKASVEGVCFRL